MSEILHIGGNDKFIAPFVELVKENFDFENHQFHLMVGIGEELNEPNIKYYPATITERLKYYLLAVIKMQKADKIILHGLFDWRLVFVLFWMPWVLNKCYWVMWGGDLYVQKLGVKDWRWKRSEFFRKSVIKNIGHLVTYIKGDVELARQWYGAKGKYIECIMYPSNLYKEYELSSKKDGRLTILLGNSADPTNNHSEVLQKLAQFKDKDIKVITPLSYGDQNYAQQVAQEGERLLGDKYQALTEFLPFDDYLKILAEVDVAIFNHRRQQAMGNTITLLGLGKKVYMRSETTQWQLFQDLNIEVHDVVQLENTLLESSSQSDQSNQKKIEQYFSKENYLTQLNNIFSA